MHSSLSHDRRTAKHREYSSFTIRQSSFNGVQITTGQTHSELAHAGFFYAGHKNYVRCFFCGILVTNLRQEQDPHTEHERKSPNCRFLHEPRLHNRENHITALDTTGSNQNISGMSNESTIQVVLNMGYEIEDIRIAYQLCNETNTGLGSVDVAQLTNRLIDMKLIEQENQSNRSNNSIQSTEINVEESCYIQRIEKEVHQLRETLMCKICMDRATNTVIMPCGHFTSCMECSSALTNCPQCRVGIVSKIRVYM